MLDNEEILPLLDKYNGLSYRTGPGFNETQLELHSLTSKLRRRLYSIAVIHCMSSLAFGYNLGSVVLIAFSLIVLVIVSPALSFIANAFGLATISEEVVVRCLRISLYLAYVEVLYLLGVYLALLVVDPFLIRLEEANSFLLTTFFYLLVKKKKM